MSGSEGAKANVPFCLEAFLTVIAACLFWFSEISKPTREKKIELCFEKQIPVCTVKGTYLSFESYQTNISKNLKQNYDKDVGKDELLITAGRSIKWCINQYGGFSKH